MPRTKNTSDQTDDALYRIVDLSTKMPLASTYNSEEVRGLVDRFAPRYNVGVEAFKEAIIEDPDFGRFEFVAHYGYEPLLA